MGWGRVQAICDFIHRHIKASVATDPIASFRARQLMHCGCYSITSSTMARTPGRDGLDLSNVHGINLGAVSPRILDPDQKNLVKSS